MARPSSYRVGQSHSTRQSPSVVYPGGGVGRKRLATSATRSKGETFGDRLHPSNLAVEFMLGR